jgi:Fe-S cluster assembly protein SufB
VAQTETEIVQGIGSDYATKYGFANPDEAEAYFFKSGRGLSHELVEAIAEHKHEPEWMRKFRHDSLDYFLARPLPTWGGDLSGIDFDNIYYYIRPTEKQAESWEDLPAEIRDTWDKLGIPEAEKKYLAGVGAQYESEVVYHKLQAELDRAGRAFPRHGLGPARARGARQGVLRDDHPEQRQQVRGAEQRRLVGRLVHLRATGRQIELPLQAYFRINAENMGQFERTLIIVDEDAYVHYVEGCTAPIYSSDSLHSAVVEIVVKPRGRCRYTTIQNWSNNVYNLVTKRAVAYEGATMEWVDGNLGSKLTMKYPAIWLVGESGHGEVLSIAVRGLRPAPGRGRQGRPPRAEHHLPDHLEVDLEGRRPRRLPRPAAGREGREEREVEGRLRRADPRRGLALRHLPVHPDRRERGRHRPRGDGVEDRRGAALLPDVARALRGRGLGDGRLRLRRADRQGAPARVRVEMNRLIQLQMEGSVG